MMQNWSWYLSSVMQNSAWLTADNDTPKEHEGKKRLCFLFFFLSQLVIRQLVIRFSIYIYFF